MKKIVVCSLIATSLMFGVTNDVTNKKTDTKLVDNKPFDLNKINDGYSKGYLGALQSVNQNIATVIHDYYAAKYCDDDYYTKLDSVTIEKEVKELGASVQYGVLISSIYNLPDSYKKIVNNYRFMNCGIGSFEPNVSPVK